MLGDLELKFQISEQAAPVVAAVFEVFYGSFCSVLCVCGMQGLLSRQRGTIGRGAAAAAAAAAAACDGGGGGV